MSPSAEPGLRRYAHHGFAVVSDRSRSTREINGMGSHRTADEGTRHAQLAGFAAAAWGNVPLTATSSSVSWELRNGSWVWSAAPVPAAPERPEPPYARVAITADHAQAGVDDLGFGHLYHRQLADGASLSTSARALGLLDSGELCAEGVALQSLLGWQVGSRTMFSGVRKIPAGGRATLREGRVTTCSPPPHAADRQVEHPARAAAARLREVLAHHLDEHPDAELQLTGGLDSRILLAAVPPARRAGLNVMTLTVPGNEDTAIAAELAERYRMRHRLASLAGLAELAPEQAFDLCLVAARRVDSAADPLALAAVDFAEMALETRPRIGGLGGEVARGFYYFGPVTDSPVTPTRVRQLARWRMFTNEAAPTAMFEPEFASWAVESALNDIHSEFVAGGLRWFPAMDQFYLGQRMQRWAGVLASATASERSVVHPMLDGEFLAIVGSVPPRMKKNARFLSQILLELDPELAQIRMDARPAPMVYAQPSPRSRAAVALNTARKVRRKIGQRLTHHHRAPEGGEILADLVLQHLRSNPSVVGGIAGLGMISSAWLEQLIGGQDGVEASAVSLLVNLLATRAGA